jgi:hypothetical protein
MKTNPSSSTTCISKSLFPSSFLGQSRAVYKYSYSSSFCVQFSWIYRLEMYKYLASPTFILVTTSLPQKAHLKNVSLLWYGKKIESRHLHPACQKLTFLLPCLWLTVRDIIYILPFTIKLSLQKLQIEIHNGAILCSAVPLWTWKYPKENLESLMSVSKPRSI